MRIVIIGSGNVATILGKIIKKASHEVVQVVSRDIENAKILAGTLGCDFTSYDGAIQANSDIYLFAISDRALLEIPATFNFGDKLVLHTAGSISMDVLQTVAKNYGILYPLQSLRKEMETIPEIPLLIEGNSRTVNEKIENFANTLSSNVSFSNEDERSKLHLAAVVVCNFTNHLFAMTEEFCKKERIDFSKLHPIIQETATRLSKRSASELQTGPAMRNDFVTIDKHLKMLNHYPSLKNLYLKITDSIINNS
ncbi:MAG: DUF2520 domain-containing protein [Bacteroidota bacterium]